MNARAQIGAAPVQSLDTITVAASKTEERAIDALAPVSVVTLEQIQGRQASTLGGLLYNIPGVWVQERGDEPSTVDQHPRPAGFRPRRRGGRRRAAELSAHRPFRERLVLPQSGTGRRHRHRARSDREHLRLRRDRRRGLVPHQGHRRRRAPGRALGRGRQDRSSAPTMAARSVRSSAAFTSIPNVDVFAGGTYSTQENYKDGTGYRSRQYRKPAHGRHCQAHGAAGRRARSQARHAYSRKIFTASASRRAAPATPIPPMRTGPTT